MHFTIACLGNDLLVQIARFCALKDAGHLSVTSQHLNVAITPVLPSLTDVQQLGLVTYGRNGYENWGVKCGGVRIGHTVTTTRADHGVYRLQSKKCCPMENDYSYFFKLGDLNSTSELLHLTLHSEKLLSYFNKVWPHGKFNKAVLHTIVQSASDHFESLKARHTVNKFLLQAASWRESKPVNHIVVANAIKYKVMMLCVLG